MGFQLVNSKENLNPILMVQNPMHLQLYEAIPGFTVVLLSGEPSALLVPLFFLRGPSKIFKCVGLQLFHPQPWSISWAPFYVF